MGKSNSKGIADVSKTFSKGCFENIVDISCRLRVQGVKAIRRVSKTGLGMGGKKAMLCVIIKSQDSTDVQPLGNRDAVLL